MMEDIERFAGLRLGSRNALRSDDRLGQRLDSSDPVGDRRQPYTITAEGRQYLEQELRTSPKS